MNISKSFDGGVFVMGRPSDADFVLIKALAPSDEISADDVFVYKIVLCDNKLDRDLERFSHAALEEAAVKFNGVIGIEDHQASVKYNHSRLYKTELVQYDNQFNDKGETYEALVGYAYTLDNDKNSVLIDEIKAGLRKEVSVSFVGRRVCSVCGKPLFTCEHLKGQNYQSTENDGLVTCEGIIESVDDAYEWSFVSIPAQRGAGVTKSFTFKKEDKSMDLKKMALEIAKGLDAETSVEFLKAVDDALVPESEVVKSLRAEVATLSKSVSDKDDEIKALKDAAEARVVEDALDDIFEQLVPKNDTMRELANKVIEGMISVDEEGKACGADAALDKLSAEEYAPLFEKATDPGEPDDKGDEDKPKDKGEETPGEPDDKGEEEETPGVGVKNFSAREAMKKGLDFSRVSQFKGAESRKIVAKPGFSVID